MTTMTASAPLAVFEREDDLAAAGHEQILFCRDDETGLRAIIGIHSTRLGPALGGTRFKAYSSEADALRDVLRLSEGMTAKAAAVGLPLGGGKAVILGDPDRLKTPNLLAAYGRFVERLGGHYVTAADIGTTAADLDIIGTQTRHVVGRTRAAGGSGDSGLSTAIGVFQAMNAAAELVWGPDGLKGRRVGVEGVGKVGRHLVDLLVSQGTSVSVSDPSHAAVRAVMGAHGPDVHVVDSARTANVDVYAPCALGASLAVDTLDELRASLVCGAANNQLASSEVDEALLAREVVWVPDFVANAGGLIQVGGELLGRNAVQVRQDVHQIGQTTRQVLEAAMAKRLPTGAVCAALVQERLAACPESR
jgi:valine dehydrogenase (NAD+)